MSAPVKSLLASFALLLALAAPASAKLRIVAPVVVKGPQPVRFAATASQPTEEVAFYVDGRKRFVDRAPGWKVGRKGYVGVGVGRHELKVEARNGRAVTVTKRALYVEPVEGPTVADAEATPSVPSPGNSDPNLLFEGNQIDDFINQSAPGAVREVSDPAGGSQGALQMTVADSDVAPITPTDDPRAQLVSPSFIEPGDEFWWHFSFYLPNDFPAKVPGWLLVGEGPYGFPWNGSPPVSVGLGETMGWQRNGTYDYDVPWQQPFERGKWTDVLMHIRFAGQGFVETWIDGEQVTFFGPDSYNPNDEPETTRLEMATRDSSNDGGKNFIVLQNYREAGMFDSATVYHGPTKVGTTRASVEG